MSLMNDMLRDLDRRGARRDDAPQGDYHRAMPSSRIGPIVMVFLAVALIAVGVVFWWPSQDTDPSVVDRSEAIAEASQREARLEPPQTATAPPPETVPAEDKDRVTAVSKALEVPQQQNAAEAKELDVPENVGLSREQEDAIASLLQAARNARARDRLTRPVGANAYEYYQQVLAISPEEPEALAGLAAIAQRYRELAEAAMDRNALPAAQQFLQRARSVRPGAEGIRASEARLEELSEKSVAENEAATVQASANSAEPGSLSVRPDPESVDQRRAAQAERLWAEGQPDRAQRFLENGLDEWSFENAEPVQSLGVLFELYLEAGALSDAEQLLARGQLPADETVRRRAQLALTRGQTAQALELLKNGAEDADQNEAYRAMMARLYYQQKQFDEAARHYQALLTDMGNRPAYWLGLGLAQDARDEVVAALNAFRQALASGAYRDDAAVSEYLTERVNALSRRTQTQES